MICAISIESWNSRATSPPPILSRFHQKGRLARRPLLATAFAIMLENIATEIGILGQLTNILAHKISRNFDCIA